MQAAHSTIEYTVRGKVVSVQEEWGMYSPAGNQSLTKKAVNFMKKVESLNDDDYPNFLRESEKFLRAYKKMFRTKQFSEASTVDVVHEVGLFFVDACEAMHINSDSLWTEYI